MNSEFEEKKAVYKKVLTKLVEMKYITINESVSEDGIASMFANERQEYDRKQKMDEAFAFLFRMKQYFPMEFKASMKVLEKENK